MRAAEITLDHLAAANPVPAHGLDIDDSVLLPAIRERSVDMSTSTEHQATKGIPARTSPRPPTRPPGWMIAVAAFVIVIVIGAAVVIGRSTVDVAPAAPPTTQAAPDDGTSSGATFDTPIPVTMETLVGIWLLDGGPTLVRFSPDGTYAIDREGALDTAPFDSGTFELSGSTLTFIAGESTNDCRPGDRIVWEDVALIETGRLIQTHASDECIGNNNPDVGQQHTWTIISPRRGSTPN